MLAPELGTTYARLAYGFGFCYLVAEDAYATAETFVDAHIGEIVHEEIPIMP